MSDDNKEEIILFNPADFQSIEIIVDFENLTTRVSIKDGKRHYGDKADDLKGDQEIRFIEFLEDEGLVLECPPNSGATGHSLKLTIKILNSDSNQDIEVTGNILEAENLPNKNQRISVKLTQFESADWFALKAKFSNRQEEVLEFFKAVKGM